MQIYDINRDSDAFSNSSISFFLRSNHSQFDSDLFALQNMDPDPLNFPKFQNNKKLSFLCLDKTIGKSYSVGFDSFHSFPVKFFKTYDDISLEIDKERINYLELNSEVQGTIVYRTLSMPLDLPYGYEDEESAVNSQGESDEEEKSEYFDSQKKRWKNLNEIVTFESFYKISRFSQDLINLVSAVMSETSGFVIYPEKREILVIENREIISRFEAESLMIKKIMTFFGKTDPEKIKAALKITAEEMIAMKTIFLQAVNEIGAFQFRKELQHDKFLRHQCNYFKFIEEDILQELDKENSEEMDRDVREEWVSMALGNMENFIKSIGKK